MIDPLIPLLKDDCRLSNEDLAKMLNISADEVKNRIKKLEADKVILKYSAITNDELLNGDNEVSAFIEVKVTPERDKGFDSIARRLQHFPEVQSVYLTSGAYDLMVVVRGDNLKEVARFVSEKLSALGNVLSTATHFLLKTYKENGVVMDVDQDSPQRLNVSF